MNIVSHVKYSSITNNHYFPMFTKIELAQQGNVGNTHIREEPYLKTATREA